MQRSSPRTSPRQSPRSAPNAVSGGLTLPRAGLIWYAKDGVDTIGLSIAELYPLVDPALRTIISADGGATKRDDADIVTAALASPLLNSSTMVGSEDEGIAFYAYLTTPFSTLSKAARYLKGTWVAPSGPTSFTFTDATGAELSTLTESAAITVAGLDVAVWFSVTGGEAEVNDSGTWVTSGVVINTDTVKVRRTSSADYETAVSVVLDINGVSDTFGITTRPATTDYTADAATVGAWLFDNDTGILAEGDRSSSDNHVRPTASMASGGAPSIFGVGKSRVFPGSAGFILMKTDADTTLHINGASAKLSLFARFRCTTAPATSAFQTIVGKYDGASNNRQYCLWIVGTGSSKFKVQASVAAVGTAASTVMSTTTTLSINTDYSVELVSDGTDLRIYIDGVLNCTPVAHTAGIYAAAPDFCIGAQRIVSGSLINGFIGNIYECLVSTRAHSSTEALELHQFGIDGLSGTKDGDFSVFHPPVIRHLSNEVILTYPNVIVALDNLCTANGPEWVATTFGTSAQGNAIRGAVITPSVYDKTVIIDSSIHGNEKIPVRGTLDLLTYLAANKTLYNNIRLIVLPVVNPDGYIANQRKNDNTPAGREVDINRNFTPGWGDPFWGTAGSSDPSSIFYKGPAAMSEPESIVLDGLISTYSPDFCITCHSTYTAVIGSTSRGDSFPVAANVHLSNEGWETQTIMLADPAGTWRDQLHAAGVETYEYEIGFMKTFAEVNKFISFATYALQANQ